MNKSSTYVYGDRNQLTSTTGYYREGTTDTGAITYTWDVKGNMKTRDRQNYYWNEDNRLTEAASPIATTSPGSCSLPAPRSRRLRS